MSDTTCIGWDNDKCDKEGTIVVFVRRTPSSLEFLPTDFRMCLHHGANGHNTLTRSRYRKVVAAYEQKTIEVGTLPKIRFAWEADSTHEDMGYFLVGYDKDSDPIGGVHCTPDMAQWLADEMNRGR